MQVETILESPAEAKQRKRQACEAEIAGYMRDRADNVARMRNYVEQHNLRNVDPLGARCVGVTSFLRFSLSPLQSAAACAVKKVLAC